MKRAGNLYPSIADRDNLHEAFCKAAKGKRKRPDVVEFQRNYYDNIETMLLQLRACEPDIGHYRYFTVRDPKVRRICAASFPERVLHHAVMNVCEPVLEKYAIFDSYACRKEKGPQRAVKRARKFSRKHPWYLQLDIRKYFDSIDHFTAMKLLCRRIKDDDVLILFQKILDTYYTVPGKGMPIGNLISQHLANFYLGPFDHWVKEELKIKGYLRYMDDAVLFASRKDRLKELMPRIRDYLRENLRLELKMLHLNRCRCGITYLGYRVFPDRLWLSARSKRRFVRKFIAYEGKWVRGEWSTNELVRHMEPLFAFTKLADSSTFRKNVMQRHGVPY